nr:MAG TPA: hypothetical protein [Caudoviricetes sp.]
MIFFRGELFPRLRRDLLQSLPSIFRGKQGF